MPRRVACNPALFRCRFGLRFFLVVVVVLIQDIEGKAPGLVVRQATVIRDNQLDVQVAAVAFLEVRKLLVQLLASSPRDSRLRPRP